MSEPALRRGLPVGPGQISDVLSRLQVAGLVKRRGGKWSLMRKINEVPLEEVTSALGFNLESSERWPPEVRQIVREWLQGSKHLNRERLAGLLSKEDL